jgi:N-acetyl-gamma-glutamyl-phosphate reductase
LTEVNRENIKQASLVANPGCYPTSVLLGVYPLLKNGIADNSQPIIIDSKSGVSGAGRKATLATSFVEVNENLSPYNIGHVHRHTGEIEQELNKFSEKKFSVIFSPHLLPVSTGMLSTIYVKLRDDYADCTDLSLMELYCSVYRGESFIKLLPIGQIASVKHSLGTNYCAISIHGQLHTPYVIIVSSIDNLIKGASGQAVQNMNVMFGLSETTGLLS